MTDLTKPATPAQVRVNDAAARVVDAYMIAGARRAEADASARGDVVDEKTVIYKADAIVSTYDAECKLDDAIKAYKEAEAAAEAYEAAEAEADRNAADAYDLLCSLLSSGLNEYAARDEVQKRYGREQALRASRMFAAKRNAIAK